MKLRILCACAVAIVAMAFGASSALAVTVSPSGSFSATAAPVNFKVGQLRFTCTSSRMTAVVGTDSAFHPGGLGFTGCQGAFGPVSITAKENLKWELGFDQNGLNTTLRNYNLAFSTAAEGCRFNVTGYESTSNLGTSPITLKDLVFPSGSTAPATLALTSFPAGETSHCFNTLSLNSPVEFSADYKLSPQLVVTK